jgi:Fe2+ or Zn2+ uptake regulation protein
MSEIINNLRAAGHRITPVRKSIIEILEAQSKPINARGILGRLGRKLPKKPNKSTVYRELDFLLRQEVVLGIDFGDGSKRFELSARKHHHHLVCLNCKRVEDVELERKLSAEQKRIEHASGFKIKNHALEFFGLCNKCLSS